MGSFVGLGRKPLGDGRGRDDHVDGVRADLRGEAPER